MPAVYFGSVFAVDNHGSVLGYILVGEMNHNVFLFEPSLKCFYINRGYRSRAFKRERRRFACRLTGKYGGRNYTEKIPAVAGNGDAEKRVPACINGSNEPSIPCRA